MRTTTDHLRRREAFIGDALALALEDRQRFTVVTRRPVTTPHGAESLEATVLLRPELTVWDVDGPTMARGFAALWEDRRDNGSATALPRVSTAWRNRMLGARSVNSTEGLTTDDAGRILQLALLTEGNAR